MRCTICIETAETFYEINNLIKEEVESIAGFFEDRVDNFFFLGIKYEIKDIHLFKVFTYETEQEYFDKINESEELMAEGYFVGNKVFFKAETIEKLFPDVTNLFVKKFSIDRNNFGIIFYDYINKARIDDLRIIKNNNFDMKILLKLCDEINESFNSKCYIATIILLRALLDHIPPIFIKKSFAEVANNHGGKSFKETMLNLENSSRKIANLYLHKHITSKEETPLEQQVNYSQSLDLLLSEIIKILK